MNAREILEQSRRDWAVRPPRYEYQQSQPVSGVVSARQQCDFEKLEALEMLIEELPVTANTVEARRLALEILEDWSQGNFAGERAEGMLDGEDRDAKEERG